MWIAKASAVMDKLMYTHNGGKPWLELNTLQTNATIIQHKPIDWDVVLDFLKSF